MLLHYTGHSATIYEPHSAEYQRAIRAGVGGVVSIGPWYRAVVVVSIFGLRVEYREVWARSEKH